MPKIFWMITYGALIWNREMMAFVPACVLGTTVKDGEIKKFWFLGEEEAKAQSRELKMLGVEEIEIQTYKVK